MPPVFNSAGHNPPETKRAQVIAMPRRLTLTLMF